MTRIPTRWIAMLGLAVVGVVATSGLASAQSPQPEPQSLQSVEEGYAAPQIDVFYNMYPNTMYGVNSAQLYPSPLPVPANVGHTYYTYQPLLPHEYLYAHRRTYYSNYAGPEAFYQGVNNGCAPGYGGYNKTTVVWHSSLYHWNQVPLQGFPLQRLRSAFQGGGHQHGCQSCGGHGCSHCR